MKRSNIKTLVLCYQVLARFLSSWRQMEITSLYVELPLWSFVCVVCAAALYVYGTKTHKMWKDLKVNGPTATPFFGNVHEMFDEKVGVREAIRRWQDQYGRIVGIYFFRKPVLVVTDPEALKQIFVKDFNSYVDRFFVGEGKLQHPIIQMNIFFAQGAAWRRLRKMMTPTFSRGKLKLLTDYINRTARQLTHILNSHATQGTAAEAKKIFGAYALDVIAGTGFGLDLDSLGDLDGPFIQHAKSLMTVDKIVQLKLAFAGIFPVSIPLLRFFNVGFFRYSDIKFFRDSLRALVTERMVVSKGGSDFLKLLMETEFEPTEGIQGETKLSMEEIAAQGLFFLIAGYETTSTTLQYLFYELARHQEVQGRIADEIMEVFGMEGEPTYDKCLQLKYTEAAIEETLRMYPPVHILTRKTTKATMLNGTPVPANVGIIIPVYNIGRDPEFYPDPDTFNPERFLDSNKRGINPMTFAPFGLGPRQCIGLRLAIMELKIALVHVLRKLKVESASPDVLEIEDFTGTLVPKIPIRVKFQVKAAST